MNANHFLLFIIILLFFAVEASIMLGFAAFSLFYITVNRIQYLLVLDCLFDKQFEMPQWACFIDKMINQAKTILIILIQIIKNIILNVVSVCEGVEIDADSCNTHQTKSE